MIRVLKKSDIKGLNRLSPVDWNFDFEEFILDYIDTDFYYAFVLVKDDKIICTGNIFLKGNTGWLANIITSKDHRGQGYGSKMTKFLVDFIKSKECKTQLLIATAFGESVYNKIGFRKVTDYIMFESDRDYKVTYSNAIRSLNDSDLANLYEFDAEVNDEDRSHFIDKHYATGYGYYDMNNKLAGLYLPDFGRGLVLAKCKDAGFELLKIKHAIKGQKTMLPIENHNGIDFLKSLGLKGGPPLSRMILGKEKSWKPKWIYSYGGGFCG